LKAAGRQSHSATNSGSARNGASGRAARPGKARLRSAVPRMQRPASRQWKCR
jgi:hypothetical protein